MFLSYGLITLAISLAGVTVKAPAKLEIRDIQACYGFYGPERKNLEYYLPQDDIEFRFAAHGVTYRDRVNVDIDVTTDLLSPAGTLVLRNADPAKERTCLGGNVFVGYTHLPLQSPLPPGDYTARVTVRDNVSSAEAKFERTVHLRPMRLAVTEVKLTYDREGKVRISGSSAGLGAPLFYELGVVGVDQGQEIVGVSYNIKLLDADTGQLVQEAGPFKVSGPCPHDPTCKATLKGCLGFMFRTGRFRMHFDIKDIVSDQTTLIEIPLHVIGLSQ